MTKLNILQGLTILFCIATLIFVVAFAWTGGLGYMLTAITAFAAAAMNLVAYDRVFLSQRFNQRLDQMRSESLGA